MRWRKLSPTFFPARVIRTKDGPVDQVEAVSIDELGSDEPEDLRDAPMEVVLAGCPEKLRKRLLSDLTYSGVETIGQLVAWLEGTPGRSLGDVLSRSDDLDSLRAAIFGWADRWEMRKIDLTVDGIPRTWFTTQPKIETYDGRLTSPIAPSKTQQVVERARAAKAKLPALPTETQFKLREALDSGWIDWETARKNKSNDADLSRLIGDRFAAVPKEKRGRLWSCQGGDDPKFWKSASGYKSARNALKGQELIDAVRDVMQIPKP